MRNTLLQDAKNLAMQSGLVSNETFEDVKERTIEQLIKHITNVRCPVLTEMILTNFSHPLTLSLDDTAKVITNHAKQPTFMELPVPDVFGQELYHSRKMTSGNWSILCVEFPNIFRTDLYFAPNRDITLGFEIVTYSIETRMYDIHHNDLPREIAVKIMSRDPKILS